MANNNSMTIEQWVDERMATLSAPSEFPPDARRAWSRLQAETGKMNRRHAWVRVAISFAAVAICLMILPTPIARKCVDCSIALWRGLSSNSVRAANLIPVKDRKPAPDFTRQDASGKSLQLSALKGKVVLLNFWATWCGGCEVEIPWLIDFQKQYEGKGLAVVGVSTDADGWKSVRPYMSEKKMNYTVVLGDDDLQKSYALTSMPMTIIIDREGRVAATHVGLPARADYESELQTILKE